MLPKNFRLSKKKDFEAVFQKGKSIKGVGFVLNFLEKKNNKFIYKFSKKSTAMQEISGDLKVGFIVSLKVHKKAVKRNKLKRRMREVIKDNLDKIKKGNFIVIVALPSAANFSFKEVKKNINVLLKKAHLLKNA